MSYAEFESLCKDCGMDEADARKVRQDKRREAVSVCLSVHG